MTDITIPPEALDAAAKTLCRERHPCWSIVAEIFETDHDGQATEFRSLARAVILATLETWPGMDTGPNIYGRQDAIIHLPLPQPDRARTRRHHCVSVPAARAARACDAAVLVGRLSGGGQSGGCPPRPGGLRRRKTRQGGQEGREEKRQGQEARATGVNITQQEME